MRLLEMPSWLRTWGLPFVEVEGWQSRGAELPAMPSVVIGHHTATPAGAKGDLPTLRILRDGRSDLRGPLCQVALSRSGVVHIIASGKANHAGAGRWAGLPGGVDYDARVSSQTIGIEAEHPGKGAWPQAQMDAFDRLAAALLWGIGSTYEAYCQHKEWALPRGRKVDCNFDPSAQRGRIARLLALGPHPQVELPPVAVEDDMGFIFTCEGRAYLRDGGDTVHIPFPTDLGRLLKVHKNVGELSPEMTNRLLGVRQEIQ